jgi:hypothetical protein
MLHRMSTSMRALAPTFATLTGLGLGLVLSLSACPAPSTPTEGTAAAKAETKGGAAAKGDAKADKAAKPDAAKKPLGKFVEGNKYGWTDVLFQTPEAVDAKLGTPTKTARVYETCYRATPYKVMFKCDGNQRDYQLDSGERIEVTFEDGVATAMAVIALPGAGDFDPRVALELAGLDLPGEPKASNPSEVAELWEWFNDEARLPLKKHEFRVQVSVVEKDWKRSKVEVLDNTALNDAQKAKIVEPKNPSPFAEPGKRPEDLAGGGGSSAVDPTKIAPPVETP